MKNLIRLIAVVSTISSVACSGEGEAEVGVIAEAVQRSTQTWTNFGSYNLHLESRVRFNPLQPGADADNGRALFGASEDLLEEDNSQALFEGPSAIYGAEVVSNGRTCFSCHRGLDVDFGMPDLPLSNEVPADDALFTGITADAGDDPRAEALLDTLGLTKYKINRFNPQRPGSDPFRQVFAWRKTPQLLNIGLSQGFLTDGRGRVMFETARGAVFSHTQGLDTRFDDLFPLPDGNDMEAFMFTLFSQPELAKLRDPEDPLFDDLVSDPFLTVDIQTQAQRRGSKVFQKQCMSCHSTPNVFNNLDNVEGLGNGERPPLFPSWGPSVGRTFNIGVSELNVHNLDFRRYDGGGSYTPIVLDLVDAEGTVVAFEIDQDIGLAASTARLEDVGRFKVPQLRKLAAHAPYFHDNSAPTIEAALEHHLSSWYQGSPDGARFPIRLNQRQRSDLIEFLYAL